MIEDLVLQAMEPATVQLSLEAAQDIEKDRANLETHHKQSLERAAYQADLARRRYEEVDPSNRLVAGELERRWEAALLIQRKGEEAPPHITRTFRGACQRASESSCHQRCSLLRRI